MCKYTLPIAVACLVGMSIAFLSMFVFLYLAYRDSTGELLKDQPVRFGPVGNRNRRRAMICVAVLFGISLGCDVILWLCDRM